jgi:membrane protein required for colicin V production
MGWLDIVLLVVIAIATLLGLRIGIIKAVLSLAGVIIGVILAGRFYVPLSEQLTFIPHAGGAKIVAFAIILVVVMIIAGVAASLLKWAASVVMLGWVNHLGGALFGLVLGATLCGALLATWVHFLGIGETIADSALARVLLDYFPMVLALLPDEFDAVRSFFQ